jgi:FkbM family methyltransferase
MKIVTLPKVLMPYYCSDLIRVGKDNDGGYLVNKKDIDKSSTLLSFGVGEDISFEKEFTNRSNSCNLIAYDSTVQNYHNTFFSDNKELVRENVGIHNLRSIIGEKKQVFLKCDIDGSEYEILYDLASLSDKFTGLVIEFHDVSKYTNFNEIANFISKFELRLVHTHINNYSYTVIKDTNVFVPNVIELTFSSSKENTMLKRNVDLPHLLDMPNNPNDGDFMIRF